MLPQSVCQRFAEPVGPIAEAFYGQSQNPTMGTGSSSLFCDRPETYLSEAQVPGGDQPHEGLGEEETGRAAAGPRPTGPSPTRSTPARSSRAAVTFTSWSSGSAQRRAEARRRRGVPRPGPQAGSSPRWARGWAGWAAGWAAASSAWRSVDPLLPSPLAGEGSGVRGKRDQGRKPLLDNRLARLAENEDPFGARRAGPAQAGGKETRCVEARRPARRRKPVRPGRARPGQTGRAEAACGKPLRTACGKPLFRESVASAHRLAGEPGPRGGRLLESGRRDGAGRHGDPHDRPARGTDRLADRGQRHDRGVAVRRDDRAARGEEEPAGADASPAAFVEGDEADLSVTIDNDVLDRGSLEVTLKKRSSATRRRSRRKRSR